jgi:hypothetical protein
MKKGQKISIYWEDVKKYYDKKEELVPSAMYTEGVFVGRTNDYILVKNPETINFNTLQNHPKKKPKLYAIPLVLIQEIKVIT